jgi:hypothetical protein
MPCRRALSASLAAGGRGGPLLGVTLQAALDLGLTLDQDPVALDQTGHPDLELLLAQRHGPAALGQVGEGGGGAVEVGLGLRQAVALRLGGG